MRIRIRHETAYAYETPAKAVIQTLRLTPRDCSAQHVLKWRIELDVDGRLRAGEDPLGNLTHVLTVDGPTDRLTLRVRGEVETHDTHGVIAGTVERFPDDVYLRETALTEAGEELRQFAEDAVRGAPGNDLETAHRLLAAIHEAVTFDTEITHVATTATEAFAMRRGVCQDLSHILIAAARHLGMPARYVSGYFVRVDGIVEQRAGHAWAELRIPQFGWVGFDPANGISPTDAHVRVAIGLDYLGAAPIRGSRYGGGREKLDVALNVAEAMRQTQS
jgi:transglutaminase-like putative cysteine protease